MQDLEDTGNGIKADVVDIVVERSGAARVCSKISMHMREVRIRAELV